MCLIEQPNCLYKTSRRISLCTYSAACYSSRYTSSMQNSHVAALVSAPLAPATCGEARAHISFLTAAASRQSSLASSSGRRSCNSRHVAEHDCAVADDGSLHIDKNVRSGPKHHRTSARVRHQTKRHHAARLRHLPCPRIWLTLIHTPRERLSARPQRPSVALNTESSTGNVEAGLPSAC